jgi:uncharacterized membrane protein
MERPAAFALYGLALVAVVVGVDVLFFRNWFWARLMVNDLAGERTGAREEAMFNLGFEHGQLEGGADSFASLWRKDEELRSLAAQVARLIGNARVEHRQAAAVLLEIAWSMLVSQDLPLASRRA